MSMMLKKSAGFTSESCKDNTENGVTIWRCVLSWGLFLRSSVHCLVLKPQEACYKKESCFSKRQRTKRTEFFPHGEKQRSCHLFRNFRSKCLAFRIFEHLNVSENFVR